MNTSVQLDQDDYERCLEFVLKLWYLWAGARGDFRSSGVGRDIGKYINDQVVGKLAELAMCKFVEREFNLILNADFGEYTSQEDFELGDIISIQEDGTQRNANIVIDVKNTKPTSRWELVPLNLQSTRACDYFVFISVDLPPDHIIQFFRNGLDFLESEELIAAIPSFDNIDAEIIGIVSGDQIDDISIVIRANEKLPEIDVFEGRVRPPPEQCLPTDIIESVSLILGSFGGMSFEVQGSATIYEGAVPRVRNRSPAVIHEQWLRCHEDCILNNPRLGSYELGEGLYKIKNEDLTTLREDNYAIPVRRITSENPQWREMLGQI
jgi:hypothetical protein